MQYCTPMETWTVVGKKKHIKGSRPATPVVTEAPRDTPRSALSEEGRPNNDPESQDARQCGTRFHFRRKAPSTVLPKEGWASRRSAHSTLRVLPTEEYGHRSVVPIKQEWWGFADGKRVWAIELSNGRCILSTEKKYAAWLRRLRCE